MDAHSGSATVASASGVGQTINVVLSAGTFNALTGTCGTPPCYSCSGFTNFSDGPSPFTSAVGNNLQFRDYITWNNGSPSEATTGTTWSSSNTGIATIQTSGQTNPGLMHAVGPGNSPLSFFYGSTPLYESQMCYNPCPYTTLGGPVGGGVHPTISGPNTVWWFNGQNPTGYATSIILTSSGGSGTSWVVKSGADKVTLSATTGGQITVTSTGTAFSASAGDVQLTASANSQTSDPFAITTRKPYRLVPTTNTYSCSGDNSGYTDLLHYNVQDQLLAVLPSDVNYNEHWTTAIFPVYPNNNWPRPNEGPGVTNVSDLIDLITGPTLTNAFPIPVCVGNSSEVQYWGQEWRIGSLATGAGVRVQTNTFVRFVNHAEHTSITSPAP